MATQRWFLYVGLIGLIFSGSAIASSPEANPGDFVSPFRIPVPATCVSSPFGSRHLPNSPLPNAFHNGIDLPAAVGTSVVAVAAGEVLRVQRKGPGGLEILIQHNGFVGVYSHLGLVAPAIAGGHRMVTRGEKIGTVGRSGLTFGAHLFFAMIVGNQAVDPAPIFFLPLCRQHSVAAASDRRLPTRRY
jgi:murein DD-endopeptidase MepM/ murein hydrolase activator NlpD